MRFIRRGDRKTTAKTFPKIQMKRFLETLDVYTKKHDLTNKNIL